MDCLLTRLLRRVNRRIGLHSPSWNIASARKRAGVRDEEVANSCDVFQIDVKVGLEPSNCREIEFELCLRNQFCITLSVQMFPLPERRSKPQK